MEASFGFLTPSLGNEFDLDLSFFAFAGDSGFCWGKRNPSPTAGNCDEVAKEARAWGDLGEETQNRDSILGISSLAQAAPSYSQSEIKKEYVGMLRGGEVGCSK